MSRNLDQKFERFTTVVSIVPFGLEEFKPGIYPGSFIIPPATNNNPEILHVGESIYHVEIDENRSIIVKVSPEDMAESIVKDYLISNLGYDPENDAMPGIFWLPGKIEKPEIRERYTTQLDQAINRQTNWFRKLVTLADDDWERTRQHKFISDMQRFAAKALGMEKPWILPPQKITLSSAKCFACQSPIPLDAIICPNCRFIVDKEKWELIKANFATKE